MKLNKKGLELYELWFQNYRTENNRLGGDYDNGDIIEGWCIIDNYEWTKTLTDECGLWVFGYDDSAVYVVDEYIENYGRDDIIFTDYDGKQYTAEEFRNELLQYFEEVK